MELASTPTNPPQALSPLQAAILGAINRYQQHQAKPVTIRDVYRRLRLNRNLTQTVVRELHDMGLLDVRRFKATNHWDVLALNVTEAGEQWLMD